MSVAMTFLTLTTLFLILLWMPYILAAFFARGVMGVLGYPDDPQPLPGWADRAKRAHANLVENFAPFAALIIIAELSNANPAMIGKWAGVFFAARIAYWLIFVLKIPVARTLAFLVGFAAQIMIVLEIAGAGNSSWLQSLLSV